MYIKLLVISTLFVGVNSMGMRSDSIKVNNTEIHLKIKNFNLKKINGYCKHSIKFIKNSDYLLFDLSNLNVDSVLLNNVHAAYQRTPDKININLPRLFLPGDSCQVVIYYQGTPAADPSGWGGFYFSGDYAFNLGVGFQVYPHSYGRAWFPCIDEFTMKSKYDFYIETDTNYTAACNGVLISEQKIGNSKFFHYQETNVMSSYLASVSVSKYSVVKNQYQGIEKSFPVWLHCLETDSIKVKNSFKNLNLAIKAFEEAFGPQVYNRVGYNFVPFSSGAMEHAGNITYPKAFADGSSNYETLMAHELSHHWWGNNVTCDHEKDMWLNEGWASYCEHFFNEKVYGLQAYKKSILSNHLNVLRMAHINDGQVFSITDIPTTNTYGSHVYKKGADVIHSLRGVVGDSLFFKACKDYQKKYRYSNANTDIMKQVFVSNGGNELAEHFFENWVKEPGFPHIVIKKQKYNLNNQIHEFELVTRQMPRFTEKLYKQLPIEVFFFKDKNTFVKKTVLINQYEDTFKMHLPFKPIFTCIDYNEKISDAITDRTVLIFENTTVILDECFAKIYPKKVKDTSLIRLEHHWVGAEKYRTSQPLLSNYRYHSLDGIFNDSLEFDLELTYDGRTLSNLSTSYLDHTLGIAHEDSMVLMYRAFPGDYWRQASNTQWTTGNKIDRTGKVLIKSAKKGDYAFAYKNYNLANKQLIQHVETFKVSPNPVDSQLKIEFNSVAKEGEFVQILNLKGEMIKEYFLKNGEQELSIETTGISSGKYIVVHQSNEFISYKRIVVQH